MNSDCRNCYSNPHWKAAPADTSAVIIGGGGGDSPLSIPARALNIVWGNDTRYWQWILIKEEESRKIGFKEAAVLVQVNWLEVTGKIDLKLPPPSPSNSKLAAAQKYTINYIIKFRADAFGWHSAPIKFKVRVINHNNNGSEEEEKEETISCEPQCITLESYRVKHDDWHEVPGGQFTLPPPPSSNSSSSSNNNNHNVISIEFGMFEVDSDWWKGSMVLAGVKLVPNY